MHTCIHSTQKHTHRRTQTCKNTLTHTGTHTLTCTRAHTHTHTQHTHTHSTPPHTAPTPTATNLAGVALPCSKICTLPDEVPATNQLPATWGTISHQLGLPLVIS